MAKTIETPTSYPDGAFDGITTHVYTQAGTYTVTLTVTDEESMTDQDQASEAFPLSWTKNSGI
jgi:hypothetical protein